MSVILLSERRKAVRGGAPDRRTTPRGRVLFGGKILHGQAFTADCIIRDLSAAGACVRLSEHEVIPPNLHLIVVRDGMAHKARTAWTRPPFAGLAFESTHDLQVERGLQVERLRQLWMALAPRSESRPV